MVNSLDEIELVAALNIFDITACKRGIVHVSTSTLLSETLQLLKEQNIISVPIFNEKINEYIGIVSAFDIMTYIVFGMCQGNGETEKFHFHDVPIKDLLGLTEESKTLWKFKSSESMSTVLEAMSKGVHHVLAFDVDSPDSHTRDDAYRMISQTDIVRYIAMHCMLLGEKVIDMTNKTLSELYLDCRPKNFSMACIDTKTTAIEAFRRIYLRQVQALAVTDADGRLVATLSASDMRGMDRHSTNDLKLPVLEFLKSRCWSRQSLHPIAVKSSSTLAHVMNMLILAGVHRIFIVDDNFIPSGVVSLSDVLTKFSNYDFRTPDYM